MLVCSPTAPPSNYFSRSVLRTCYTRSAARASVAVEVDLMPNNPVDTTTCTVINPNHPPGIVYKRRNAQGPSRSRPPIAGMTYKAEDLSVIFSTLRGQRLHLQRYLRTHRQDRTTCAESRPSGSSSTAQKEFDPPSEETRRESNSYHLKNKCK